MVTRIIRIFFTVIAVIWLQRSPDHIIGFGNIFRSDQNRPETGFRLFHQDALNIPAHLRHITGIRLIKRNYSNNRLLVVSVITSYSIHYTKLYESAQTCLSASRISGPENGRSSFWRRWQAVPGEEMYRGRSYCRPIPRTIFPFWRRKTRIRNNFV